jgi:hypothetical protein
MKSIFIITLFVTSFVSVGMILATAQAPQSEGQVPEIYDAFIDLVGTVNFTYYADGSNFEGKDLYSSLGGTKIAEIQSINFALSIGADYVFYYVNKNTGEAIADLYELYEPTTSIETLWSEDLQVSDPWWHFDPIQIDVGLGLSETEYSPGSNNLTVDSLQKSETPAKLRLADMLANTTNAVVDSTQIAPAASSEYVKHRSQLTSWNKYDEIHETVTDSSMAQQRTYGTTNMTRTVYLWLARYIEVQKGYAPFTVKIEHSTESLTSEGVTMRLNNEAHDAIGEILREEIARAGSAQIPGIISGQNVLKKTQNSVGTFSFSSGVNVADLTSTATAKASALANKAAGTTAVKSVVNAASGIKSTIGSTVAGATNYVQQGTSKLTNFVSDGAGKLKDGAFGFLGGVTKVVKKIGNFLANNWWWILLLLVIGIILFATPVGPLLAQNTVKRYMK